MTHRPFAPTEPMRYSDLSYAYQAKLSQIVLLEHERDTLRKSVCDLTERAERAEASLTVARNAAKLAAEDAPMTLNAYQQHALRTANNATIEYLALGVSGEGGEIAEHVKKHIGQGHLIDPEHLAKEIGDDLWYLSVLAWLIGYTLEQVAALNVEKLRRRYPDGFDSARSITREAANG